jgi:PAS domain S-box-containing protein/putative nucleotidyltransferase with HDIG domain
MLKSLSNTHTKSKIVIADDDPMSRVIYQRLLDGHHLTFAYDGEDALKKALVIIPDIILLDVMMPNMDGYEVCSSLRANEQLATVPIIMITSLDDRAARLKGLAAGADDFLKKPVDHVELLARVRSITRLNRYQHLMSEKARFEQLVELSPDGILICNRAGNLLMVNSTLRAMLGIDTTAETDQRVFDHLPYEEIPVFVHNQNQLFDGKEKHLRFESRLVTQQNHTFPVDVAMGAFEWSGERVVQVIVRDVTERKQAEKHIHQLNSQLLNAYDATLTGWAKALELRDDVTEGHTQRVTQLTVDFARALGLPQPQLEHIRRGAILHDIGKMGIPDHILKKTDSLTEQEWKIMQKHPVFAAELLAPIQFLAPALDIPRYHHEKWDGSGYPLGLKGTEIPLAARIFSIVDVWDALTCNRPYRPAWPRRKVAHHLRTLAGSHFDPNIVELFLKFIKSSRPLSTGMLRKEPVRTN